jgi:phosphoglycerate dehydrogenase-like enzyme
MTVPRIMAIGDLPEAAMRLLDRLDYEGHIDLIRRRPDQVQPDIRQCDALIVRPTTSSFAITDATLEGTRRPLYIASLSRRIDRIKVSNAEGITIISAKGEANAPAVAEHAISLANLLLRPAHRAMASVVQGRFSNILLNSSRRLSGMTWSSLGSGNIPRLVCLRLIHWGLQRFNIWHPLMNHHRFESFVDDVAARAYCRPAISDPSRQSAVIGNLLLTGSSNLDDSLEMADMVSIHLPLCSASNGGYPATNQLLGAGELQRMKPSACLINLSSGEIISEAAVLASLRTDKLGGYAADTLSTEAENEEDPKKSELWRAYMAQGRLGADEEEPEKLLNLIITPHMGGTTIDALESVSTEVIFNLLSSIGIPAHLYESLRPATV